MDVSLFKIFSVGCFCMHNAQKLNYSFNYYHIEQNGAPTHYPRNVSEYFE